MLSRIANNLFWMGRYIERAEHSSRFTKVNYFAGLDAPSNISKDFMVKSLLKMNAISSNEAADEEQALMKIGFDRENPNSIINCVISARENARSARDIISTELWETINRYYHFTIKYDVDSFTKTNLFDFTQRLNEQTSITKGRIDSTLIHNETWLIISLGLFTERCTQILRIIQTKLDDIKLLQKDSPSPALEAYQVEIMLRSLEAFDMSRKYYRKSPNLQNSLEFLLLNKKFPRSLSSCARKVRNHIENLAGTQSFGSNTAGFSAGRLAAKLNFLLINEVVEDLDNFILEIQNDISDISGKLISEYFS